MKAITFYYDPISPYAYLAFMQLPKALESCSYTVQYVPVFLGGVLKHWGQLGPAEVAPKRIWTVRHVLYSAQTLGVPLDLPATHPFNPLPLLRLAVQAGRAVAFSSDMPPSGAPSQAAQKLTITNRYVTELLFTHVWQCGLEAADTTRLAALRERLLPSPADTSALDEAALESQLKAQLRCNTDAAIAAGVFGVPALVVDGQLFWGLESLPMLAAYVAEQAVLPDAQWDAPLRLHSSVPLRGVGAG